MKINLVVSTGCSEYEHVAALKRSGVPMLSHEMHGGVEHGRLSWKDVDNCRYYEWDPESEVETASKPWWKPKFKIIRRDTLGETWYEVQEKVFYWPFWDTWTSAVSGSKVQRFKSLYDARKAIELRENPKLGPKAVTLENL